MSSTSSSYQLLSEAKSKSFAMTSEDVVCNCTNPEICIKSTFCPCLVLREIAQNMGYGEPISAMFCLTSYPVYFICKAMMGHGSAICADPCAMITLAHLGSEVAEIRGINHSMTQSCVYATCNVCTCYMCRVLHESRLYKKSCCDEEEEAMMQEEVMERGDNNEEENDEQSLEGGGRKMDDPLIVLYG